MHEMRNFILCLAVTATAVWAALVWIFMGTDGPYIWPQRAAAALLTVALLGWLVYALKWEDKLPDHLRHAVGGLYFERDGVCFMPMVRASGRHAELSVYYQNRYENAAEVIVHLRPPAESFVVKPGARDVHFAFLADGGEFGVVHQPIGVPTHLQGDVVEVQLAAAVHYPRSHGARLRKHEGLPCGTLLVDWGGAAFRTGVHEVSGEIELHRPCTLHLSMPPNVRAEPPGRLVWKHETLAAGVGMPMVM